MAPRSGDVTRGTARRNTGRALLARGLRTRRVTGDHGARERHHRHAGDAIELVLNALVSTTLGNGIPSTQPGTDLGLWRRDLHHPGQAVVKCGLGCFDEPGAFLRRVIGDFSHFWVCAVGPVAGSMLAVCLARILRGPRGHDSQAAGAAQADPDPALTPNRSSAVRRTKFPGPTMRCATGGAQGGDLSPARGGPPRRRS